jgi:hypothetical protein
VVFWKRIVRLGRRSDNRGPFAHTVITNDIADMLDKAEYENARYLEILNLDHEEAYRPLVWQAMDCCQTFSSLEAWTGLSFKATLPREDQRRHEAIFKEAVAAEIPLQGMIADIAATMRHHFYRDNRSPGGKVKLQSFEFVGLGLLSFHLQFENADEDPIPAETAFELNLKDWRKFILSRGIN